MEQKSDANPNPNLSRKRTFLMQQTLSNTPLYNSNNGCLVYDGEEYRIIDGAFRDWISSDRRKLASIGGHVFGREVLLINPYEGKLATIYREFTDSISYLTLGRDKNSQNSIKQLLSDINIYVSKLLKPDEAAVQKIIDKYSTRDNPCLKINTKSTPYIDLEVFLAENAGVCRHYAALLCVALAFAIQNNHLPMGEIILDRAETSNAVHAKVRYVSNGIDWCLDTTKLFSKSTQHLALIPEEKLQPTQPLSESSSSSPSQALAA